MPASRRFAASVRLFGRALLERVDEDVARLELAGRYTFIIALR